MYTHIRIINLVSGLNYLFYNMINIWNLTYHFWLILTNTLNLTINMFLIHYIYPTHSVFDIPIIWSITWSILNLLIYSGIHFHILKQSIYLLILIILILWCWSIYLLILSDTLILTIIILINIYVFLNVSSIDFIRSN